MPSVPEGYRKRLVEKDIDKALKSFGAVCIAGPKHSGKTWTGLSRSESAFMLGDSNGYGVSNRELADFSIRNALDGEEPHLISEWQEVPRIWDAVRSEVDRSHAKGRFIIAGSSVPRHGATIHSGAGRIRAVRMSTMSLFESGDSTGEVSLGALMRGEDIGIHRRGPDLEHLAELVIGGGWPACIGLPFEERASVVRGYLDSFVADACRMDGVRRKEQGFRMVLRALARSECSAASDSKLHRGMGALADEFGIEGFSMSYDTLRDYLDVLDRMYLTDDQPAFDPGFKSSIRVGKTPKRHLADPSLAATALGYGKDRLTEDLRTMGCLFEALCERDLRIYSGFLGGRLLHYRDANGTEADAIVETGDGAWGAFEIVLGANGINEAAGKLLKLSRKMEKHGADRMPSVLCVICGLTEYAYRRDDGVYVVPITMLGP